jgi:predicted NUDIX family phosphoesterase
MNKLEQKILCIKSDILFEKGKWNGLKTDDLDYYYNLLLEKSEFQIRGPLETDLSYKQIIPQVIIRFQDKYFLHKQVKGTEARLQEMFPLPLGGHVEEFDLETKENDLIQDALEREVNEEVEINANITKKEFLGLVYLEDENPVNHVHIGIFYIFDVDSDNVHIKESELENVGFVSKAFLEENIDKLTYWSRIILEKI